MKRRPTGTVGPPSGPQEGHPEDYGLAMACPLCDTIRDVRSHPMFVGELAESWVMLGENQGCPGWCVLIAKEHVEHLAEWPAARQARLFEDVARVASAVRAEFDGSGTPPRINYECLGNVVAHVHWHVIPRHAGDPTPRMPVWGWPPEQLRGAMTVEERAALAARLRDRLR